MQGETGIQAAGFLRLQVVPGKQPGSSLGQSLSRAQKASLPAPSSTALCTDPQPLRHEAQLGAWSLTWHQFVCQLSRSSSNTLSNEGPILGTGPSPFLDIFCLIFLIFLGVNSRQIAWSLEWTSHRYSPSEKWNCFKLRTLLDLDQYLNQYARNDPQCTKRNLERQQNEENDQNRNQKGPAPLWGPSETYDPMNILLATNTTIGAPPTHRERVSLGRRMVEEWSKTCASWDHSWFVGAA